MTPKQRFNAKVRKEPSGCWIWLGRLRDGQPIFEVDGKRVQARRWAWRSKEVPRRLGTACGQARCVRPAHLTAVWSGPKPKSPEKPDEIVAYMLEHPRDHRGCMRRFTLTEDELLEILETYYASIPRPDAPTEKAPLVSSRSTPVATNTFAEALFQLVESTDELW